MFLAIKGWDVTGFDVADEGLRIAQGNVERAGVKQDGYYALGMPGHMQQRMSDREAADVIAFVRSVPPAPKPVAEATRVYPLGRLGVLLG